MKNYITQKNVTALLLSLILLLPGVLFAQGSGSVGGSDSAGGQRDQTQDRDQIQDPAIHDGNEPDRDQQRDQNQVQTATSDNDFIPPAQDRDQDRDRIQDPTMHDGDEPMQTQNQDRDRVQDTDLHLGDDPLLLDHDQLRGRLRDQLDSPAQDRTRTHFIANDSNGLRAVITTSQEVADDIVNELSEELREQVRNRNRVEIGVVAFAAAQNIVGPLGREIAESAQNIGSSTQIAVQAEEQIKNRSRFTRFLFGGDSGAVELINNQVQKSEQHLQQIRQQLAECDCTEEVRLMLQEQLQNMEQEQMRLQNAADIESKTWGLFSWRF